MANDEEWVAEVKRWYFAREKQAKVPSPSPTLKGDGTDTFEGNLAQAGRQARPNPDASAPDPAQR